MGGRVMPTPVAGWLALIVTLGLFAPVRATGRHDNRLSLLKIRGRWISVALVSRHEL